MRLPKHATLNGTALRLKGEGGFAGRSNCMYYRDAGQWSVGFEVRGDKVFSKSSMEHLNNVELIPITADAYKKGNRGYI